MKKIISVLFTINNFFITFKQRNSLGLKKSTLFLLSTLILLTNQNL
jgi:hypothetical protein